MLAKFMEYLLSKTLEMSGKVSRKKLSSCYLVERRTFLQLFLQTLSYNASSKTTYQTTGNQTCHPGAPICAPDITFLCTGVTFLRCLETKEHLFVCPGIHFLCSSSATLKLNLHLKFNFFVKIANLMMITNLMNYKMMV